MKALSLTQSHNDDVCNVFREHGRATDKLILAFDHARHLLCHRCLEQLLFGNLTCADSIIVSASRCLNPKSVLAVRELRQVDVSLAVNDAASQPVFSCAPS